MTAPRPLVWVTGASSGIGEALARAAAARGDRVILSARRTDRLETVRAACANPGDHAIVPLDLGDAQGIRDAAARVLAELGVPDLVIHNGGVSQRSLVKDTDLSVLRRVMEINYFGAVGLTLALLPAMRARGAGRFVVVSSLTGKFGTPLRSGYAASKHALHGFFDSLRAEAWRDGIGVTIACPGFVRTQVSVNALTGDGAAQGSMDAATAKGLAPEVAAARILRAAARGRDEVVVAGREGLAVWLKRLLPGLFNRMIRKAAVT
jgi:dehydrogenase/reductase SDR family protein 7B